MFSRITAAGNLFFSNKRNRIISILIIVVYSFIVSYIGLRWRGNLASDFQWSYKAAEYILQGINPYYQVPNNWIYPYDSLYFYPLPTALFSIPFTIFEPYFAGALFFSIMSGVLAYAILRDNWQRIPVFLGAPFCVAATVAQWSPIVMAAALLPINLRVLAFLKPTSGIVAFVYKPSIRPITIYLVLIILSMVVLPSWPLDWLQALTNSNGRHTPFIVGPYGIVLILSLLAINSRSGRTLLAASLVPRHPYWYDGPILWLITNNWMQGLALSVLSWIGYFLWYATNNWDISNPVAFIDVWRWQILFMYWPLLGVVLQPKVTQLAKKLHNVSEIRRKNSSRRTLLWKK